MSRRWNGLRMMAAALVAFLLIGRLVLHVTGFVLILLVLLAFLAVVFYVGVQALLRP